MIAPTQKKTWMVNCNYQVQAETVAEAITVYQEWFDARAHMQGFYNPNRDIGKIESYSHVITK